ncbi:hypothetical protein N9N55_08025 [Opitutales bacterium]|nr:hypothetical protein [Opitutales bacterium]
MDLKKTYKTDFRDSFEDHSVTFNQAAYYYSLKEFQYTPIRGLIVRICMFSKIDFSGEKELRNFYIKERVHQICLKHKKKDRMKESWKAKDFPEHSLEPLDKIYEEAHQDYLSKNFKGLLTKIEIEESLDKEEQIYTFFIAQRVKELIKTNKRTEKSSTKISFGSTKQSKIAMELNIAAKRIALSKRQKNQSRTQAKGTSLLGFPSDQNSQITKNNFNLLKRVFSA